MEAPDRDRPRNMREVLEEELKLDERVIRLERTAERVEPMIPELEAIVEDRAYRRRRRLEHGEVVKAWQLRLAIAVGALTLLTLIAGSIAQLAHLAGHL